MRPRRELENAVFVSNRARATSYRFDTFAAQHSLDHTSDLRFFPRHELFADQRDRRAKASVRLRKLEANRPGAQYNQMLRKRRSVENAFVRDIGNVGKP